MSSQDEIKDVSKKDEEFEKLRRKLTGKLFHWLFSACQQIMILIIQSCLIAYFFHSFSYSLKLHFKTIEHLFTICIMIRGKAENIVYISRVENKSILIYSIT